MREFIVPDRCADNRDARGGQARKVELAAF
jgi:hypothetical protein